ncbi:restriction endonuclease [Streptomyces sp. NPDC051776]|uniref:restriction endonuclease n=1 Tax=Streptomyces sp. NPDC051776 TaxID=3155414 RepID=UPI00341CE6E8
MIIDRAARVTPTRFVDRDLRREIGWLIGKANRDDALRAFLWVSECRIAHEILQAWKEHIDVLDREYENADYRQASTAHPRSWEPDPRDQISRACHSASSTLAAKLNRELGEAKEAERECDEVLDQLSRQLGKLPMKVPVPGSSGVTLLDALVPLRQQLAEARARLTALIAQDREELKELALHEHSRRRSAASGSAVFLHDIDGMRPREFVSLVEALLRRDGFETARPEGAGVDGLVSATCSRGHSLLFSAHRVSGPRGWRPEPADALGAPDLHTVRLAAERLRFDDLVVVTNGSFSAPARRYAEEHDMCLWDRSELQRWAEWEGPLDCVGDHHEGAVA